VVAKHVTPLNDNITSIVQQVRALYKHVRVINLVGIVICPSAFIKHDAFLSMSSAQFYIRHSSRAALVLCPALLGRPVALTQ
jgi:hypothetical protein